jgi:DNA-binding IclR family transcriptional regulator
MITDRPLPGTPAPAVIRAAAVLRAIAAADGNSRSVSELAEEVDAPRSSVINVLAALAAEGLVRRQAGGFVIGPAVVGLAATYLRHDDPMQRFRQFVPTLRALSQETVQLATLEAADVLYLARHDGHQPITLTSGIGRRLPASSTALGKAILSTRDTAEVGRIVGTSPRRLTPRSHATLEALLADLATTRARGYAFDDEEAAPNVVCLAVALPVDGRPPAAVSTTLFKHRLTPDLRDRLVQDLHSLASHLASR